MTAPRIAPPAYTVDHAWLRSLWTKEWGGLVMVSRGKVHRLETINGLIARHEGCRAGAANGIPIRDELELEFLLT